jgi:Mce-associated membrane protein
VLPIALVVLAALLVGLGLWFQDRAGEVRYNQALVDSAGTTEVAGQAREAVEKAFSYNYADVSATEEAANELLVGKAKCQYNAIFGPVRTLAPEQKLVVTVKAVSSGVTSLDGDRATVLLFLDQVTTRTTDNQSGGGIAMMRVGAQKVDGRWRVDNMEMFGQSGDQAAETAKC